LSGAAGEPRQAAAYDLGEAIEARPFDRFALKLLLLSMLATVFDGFDLTAISFAAPTLAPALGLDPIAMGTVFSAGLAGTMLGALATGYWADRFGRKPVIVGSTAAFAVLTIALAFVRDGTSLLAVRAVQGFALGGVMPLCWALNIDYSPARRRSTIVTLVTLGFGIGSALAGPAAVLLIPRFGWPSLFVAGGIGALLCSLLLQLALPESLRFLAARGAGQPKLHAGFRRFAPDIVLPAGTILVCADAERPGRAGRVPLAALFGGRLRLVTPLLWAAYVASSISAYLFASWGPVIFEALGLTRAQAAYVASFYALTGAAGGLLLMRFTDRTGFGSVAATLLVAIPLMMTIGLVDMPRPWFVTVNLLVGLFLLGGHYGVMSILGQVYPAAIRATGTGWAASVGKVGSIVGPLVGGWLLASSLPVRISFVAVAVCPAVAALCILLVARLSGRRAPAGERGGTVAARIAAGEAS